MANGSTSMKRTLYARRECPATAFCWSKIMTIPTPARLRQQARHLDHQQRQLERYFGRMRSGRALLAYSQLGKVHFVFSDGTHVPQAVGYALTKHPQVVVVDPPLIAGGLAQTFRFADEPRRTNRE